MKEAITDAVLLNFIRKIVDGYSGGIKYTELIVTLIDDAQLVESDFEGFDERVEKVIRDSSDLKILDYTWKSCNRAKMFVYTP